MTDEQFQRLMEAEEHAAKLPPFPKHGHWQTEDGSWTLTTTVDEASIRDAMQAQQRLMRKRLRQWGENTPIGTIVNEDELDEDRLDQDPRNDRVRYALMK